jgi:hypothetical protein
MFENSKAIGKRRRTRVIARLKGALKWLEGVRLRHQDQPWNPACFHFRRTDTEVCQFDKKAKPDQACHDIRKYFDWQNSGDLAEFFRR